MTDINISAAGVNQPKIQFNDVSNKFLRIASYLLSSYRGGAIDDVRITIQRLDMNDKLESWITHGPYKLARSSRIGKLCGTVLYDEYGDKKRLLSVPFKDFVQAAFAPEKTVVNLGRKTKLVIRPRNAPW